GFAKERQQVMLAQTEKLNVLHHHHLVVGDAEGSTIEDVVDVLVIAAGQELQGLLEALRRLPQALAVGVFADELDDLRHVAGNRLGVTLSLFAQQDFFGGFVHGSGASCCSPKYSKLLFPVSSTRTPSSLALGNDFNRL